MVLGLEGVKKILQNWAIEHDLCFEILDPTLLADPCDLGLRERATSAGHRLWRQDDPVHLTADRYKDIAQAIQDCVISGPAIETASTVESAQDQLKEKTSGVCCNKTSAPSGEACSDFCAHGRLASWSAGEQPRSKG
jgi:hypothetical protein